MFKLGKTIKLFLGSFVLLGYFSILFYTPIHMMDMADMKTSGEDCPFMTAHETICTMTIGEHIRAWQSWLTNLLPSFGTFAFISTFFTCFVILAHSQQILRLLLYAKRQGWLTRQQIIISLFSQGILHTKVF